MVGVDGTEKKISIFYTFPAINTHFQNTYAAALLRAEQRIREKERSKEVKRASQRAARRETFIFCFNNIN